jgi:hypothetical protein
MNTKSKFIVRTILFSVFSFPLSTFAQGAGLTCQGRLDTAGAPAGGGYDLMFPLFEWLLSATPLVAAALMAVMLLEWYRGTIWHGTRRRIKASQAIV